MPRGYDRLRPRDRLGAADAGSEANSSAAPHNGQSHDRLDRVPLLQHLADTIITPLKEFLTLILTLAGITLFLALAFLLGREVFKQITVIEPIALPQKLTEKGYSSDMASRFLRDSMNCIIARASAPAPSISMHSDLPDIVVPTVGLSSGAIEAYLRDFFHVQARTVVSGELVGVSDRLSLRIRINGQQVFSSPGPFVLDRSEAWDAAAMTVLQQTSPHVVMWALDDDDPIAAEEFAKHIIATSSKADQAVGWAHILLGSHLLDRNKAGEAAAEFEDAITSAPKIAMAHAYLGIALTRQRRFKDAIGQFRAAIKRDPHDAAFYHYFGLTLRTESLVWGEPNSSAADEQFSNAIREYQRAIRLQPGDGAAHLNLAMALVDEGKPLEDTITEYRKAVELDPRLSRAHRGLCIALRDTERLEEAIVECKTAVELAPRNPEGHRALGDAYIGLN